MLRRVITWGFATNPKIKVDISETSDLRRIVRPPKSPRQLQWEKKMRREWMWISLSAVMALYFLKSAFPDYWFSHSFFTDDIWGLALEAKKEVEAELPKK